MLSFIAVALVVIPVVWARTIRDSVWVAAALTAELAVSAGAIGDSIVRRWYPQFHSVNDFLDFANDVWAFGIFGAAIPVAVISAVAVSRSRRRFHREHRRATQRDSDSGVEAEALLAAE
jgi:lipoprotein signal peptidase